MEKHSAENDTSTNLQQEEQVKRYDDPPTKCLTTRK